jgi:hypothetical protein
MRKTISLNKKTGTGSDGGEEVKFEITDVEKKLELVTSLCS